jgi:hypothetical protein
MGPAFGGILGPRLGNNQFKFWIGFFTKSLWIAYGFLMREE